MKIEFSTDEVSILTVMIRVHLNRAPDDRKAVALVQNLLEKLEEARNRVLVTDVHYIN